MKLKSIGQQLGATNTSANHAMASSSGGVRHDGGTNAKMSSGQHTALGVDSGNPGDSPGNAT